MARSLDIDAESDVVRGVAMGLAFLVGLALNLGPERRFLALAVFGGGAVAFFGLAALAAIDDEYAGPQLRWYLFAAWGVLLFAVGVWTESTVSGVGGIVVAVYAAVRAWLLDTLEEPDEATPGTATGPRDGEAIDEERSDEAHPAARSPATPDRAREGKGRGRGGSAVGGTQENESANGNEQGTARDRGNGG